MRGRTECTQALRGTRRTDGVQYHYTAAYGSSQPVEPLRTIAQCGHVKAACIEIVAGRGP
ncbi:hypothetical protein N8T08_008196 [Aspergillus melleus]|uniref:Uncharacterized protein n=1 Tax=Aspergillus melleus TaxID=138277 RepID=A0ACC3AWN6_9EURO|nr:hypothetical protein N8T08_008196 [Aspergillus melleus]